MIAERCHWCGLTDGVHQHGCPHQPKPTCPYVHYSDEGTAHCALAETRVADLEARIAQIEAVLRVLAVDDTGGWCATQLTVDDWCGSCVPCRKRTAVVDALALLPEVNE